MLVTNDATSERSSEGHAIQNGTFIGIVTFVLFGMTALVYWPACSNGFVKWDDDVYVYEQPRILQGITLDGIRWALTAEVCRNWHPLTLISLQLDAQLYGLDPSGFHRTAVLLHALNSVLAFMTVLVLTGCRWRSVICGSLFAMHPMHVESVAWISERKDLLSGSFFFLTLLAYVWYLRAPSFARYFVIMVFFALGLSAKPMLVTTPCVLLLLDYWPLERCRGFDVGDRRTWLMMMFEKLPLFGLSIAACILTLVYQQHAIMTLPLDFRLTNAVASYVAYLSQSFWPVGLSPHYGLQLISGLHLCGALTVLFTLTVIAIRQRIKWPYLLVGWLWFLGMLVPVIGLVYVGQQARADRYMYLPQLGLYIAVVWWITSLVGRSKIGISAVTVVAATFIAACGYATTQQIPVWHDTRSLWLRAYRLDPANYLAFGLSMKSCIMQGNLDQAIQVFTEALRNCNRSDLKAINFKTLMNTAMLVADYGEPATSVAILTKALEYHRENSNMFTATREFENDQAELFSNRGKAFASSGQWHEAVDDYRQATKLSPKSASYQFYLAHALSKTGDEHAADGIYTIAIRQWPEWPQKAAQLAWKMSTNFESKLRVTSWPVQLAEQANEATGGINPRILDVLAATYADAGRFNEAAKTVELALHAAEKEGMSAEFIASAHKRRELYLAQKPYRESSSR